MVSKMSLSVSSSLAQLDSSLCQALFFLSWACSADAAEALCLPSHEMMSLVSLLDVSEIVADFNSLCS